MACIEATADIVLTHFNSFPLTEQYKLNIQPPVIMSQPIYDNVFNVIFLV